MKTITICSSANFYKQAVEIKKSLEAAGFNVIVPHIAEIMASSNDFEVMHYKTWFGDSNDYHKKTELMRSHFDEVAKADIVLVLNYDKNGKPNYIGGNVLMEMAIAFYLQKQLYVLNQLPTESAYLEELLGMNPTVLDGNITKLV